MPNSLLISLDLSHFTVTQVQDFEQDYGIGTVKNMNARKDTDLLACAAMLFSMEESNQYI
jgi:hypothetical protein